MLWSALQLGQLQEDLIWRASYCTGHVCQGRAKNGNSPHLAGIQTQTSPRVQVRGHADSLVLKAVTMQVCAVHAALESYCNQ